MNEYSYNCTDKSIVLPYFKEYYVKWYFKLVPYKLTANFITFVSTSFIILMLFVSLFYAEHTSVFVAGIFAFCLNAYLVGDHLDGMQAKETGTGSPLGEFLDHYLDVYNGAIVVFALTVFFQPIPSEIFFGFLFVNAVSYAITMVEELETQELVFGYIGTLEGVILLILFFLSWLIPPINEFWNSQLYGGYPNYWLLIGFFGLGLLGTALDVGVRIGYLPLPFLVFTCVAGLICFAFYFTGTSNLISWAIITLISGEYIAKVMESYLLSKKHKYPDLFCILATVCFFLLTISNSLSEFFKDVFLYSLLIYLSFKVVLLFSRVVYQLREHWHWTNP